LIKRYNNIYTAKIKSIPLAETIGNDFEFKLQKAIIITVISMLVHWRFKPVLLRTGRGEES